MRSSLTPTRALRAARGLLALEGALWAVLGAGAATVAWPRLARATSAAPLLVVLVFANAMVFLAIAWALRHPTRGVLAVGGLWAVLNLVLSFTDEVGRLDLASAALSLAAVAAAVLAWRQG